MRYNAVLIFYMGINKSGTRSGRGCLFMMHSHTHISKIRENGLSP